MRTLLTTFPLPITLWGASGHRSDQAADSIHLNKQSQEDRVQGEIQNVGEAVQNILKIKKHHTNCETPGIPDIPSILSIPVFQVFQVIQAGLL